MNRSSLSVQGIPLTGARPPCGLLPGEGQCLRSHRVEGLEGQQSARRGGRHRQAACPAPRACRSALLWGDDSSGAVTLGFRPVPWGRPGSFPH